MFPSDVTLPANAKYYGFIDNKTPVNSHWEITWSFSFSLSGSEHGFCTFLTNIPTLTGGLPGQYMGYLGDMNYIKAEDGSIILDEAGHRVAYDPQPLSAVGTIGVLGIAFDTTGYFALSTSTFGGVLKSQTKRNSLIVRDSNDDLVYNAELSSLDSTFFMNSSSKEYQTLRFRLANGGKRLYIDKQDSNLVYYNLATVSISSFHTNSNSILYAGLTFCSPISSLTTPSTMYVKNFHVQGTTSTPTYETVYVESIYPDNLSTTYSSISNIL